MLHSIVSKQFAKLMSSCAQVLLNIIIDMVVYL